VNESSAPAVCMYVLTFRDGLQTRHVGPYATPQQAAQDVDRILARLGDRVHWQIHQLESPADLVLDPQTTTRQRAAA